MIKGVGTDIVDVARMREKIEKGGGFLQFVFSPAEIAYCEKQAFPAEHFAARFAAKEALLKAMGSGWANGTAFNEISIEHDDKGRPAFKFHGETADTMEKAGNTSIHVSLSHERAHALAFVIIE